MTSTNLNEVVSENPKQTEEKDVGFDCDLIRKYPKSNKKIKMNVAPYSIKLWSTDVLTSTTTEVTTKHISPHGMEFVTNTVLAEGTLVKMEISLPEFWQRKRGMVNYSRVDSPERFSVLGKVITTQETGKKVKRQVVVVQTVNIDEIDEAVLKNFLAEG